jgi:hypothetical protein
MGGAQGAKPVETLPKPGTTLAVSNTGAENRASGAVTAVGSGSACTGDVVVSLLHWMPPSMAPRSALGGFGLPVHAAGAAGGGGSLRCPAAGGGARLRISATDGGGGRLRCAAACGGAHTGFEGLTTAACSWLQLREEVEPYFAGLSCRLSGLCVAKPLLEVPALSSRGMMVGLLMQWLGACTGLLDGTTTADALFLFLQPTAVKSDT